MVLQQRLNYGFNGYQMPEVPRAARSARGRGPIRKKLEANKIHAFEILASVAGKLLQESEDPLPTNDCCGKDPLLGVDDTGKSKQQDEGNLLKEVPGEVRSFDKEETLLCGHGLQQRQQSYTLNGFSHSQENVSYEINSASKSLGHYCGSYSNKLVDSPLSNDFIEEKAQGVHKRKLETEPSKDESNRLLSSAENVLKMEGNPSVLVSSGHDVKTSFSGDCKNHGAFLCHCTKMKVGSRDDDENCAGYAQPHTMTEEFEHPPDVSDRRINNLVASRHWRVTSDVKVGGCSRNDGKLRQGYHNGRTCYSHQRSQKIYPFKKRKFLYRRPLTTSDREFENIFNSPDTRVNGDSCCAEIGPSSSTSQEVPLKSNDCNVKLSIKSFKVPELFIEIPATATVGSLKRTVMEAVTTIIGDGLHVGILVQGKKVRDDSKTLLQTGISHDDKRPNLGFILEPKRAKLTYPSCSEDPSLLSRHAVSLVSEPGTSNVSLNTLVTNTGGYVERDVKAVASVASSLTDKPPPASQAIVAVPPISVKPLTALPFHRKSGHAEYVQRRIRRPFSVSEVEALVQAVEILGTGRWRDVKLRAFESAKHRTYVDLKDKWKTLVHTARISPQQRRGEPVPQELLDRVLAAHAYWSQRHAKQLVKAVV